MGSKWGVSRHWLQAASLHACPLMPLYMGHLTGLLTHRALCSFQLSSTADHSAPPAFLPGPVPFPWVVDSLTACHWCQPGPACLLCLLSIPVMDCHLLVYNMKQHSLAESTGVPNGAAMYCTDHVLLSKLLTSLSLNFLICIRSTAGSLKQFSSMTCTKRPSQCLAEERTPTESSFFSSQLLSFQSSKKAGH